MSKNDAITYAPEKIRVNSIHPAYIWTPMVENHLRATAPDLEAAKAAADAAHPIGTMAEPDDIALGGGLAGFGGGEVRHRHRDRHRRRIHGPMT